MFEQRHHPVISTEAFLARFYRHLAIAGIIVVGSLAAGTLGYRLLAGLPWIDALLNAAMILSGMGPVDALRTDAGKLFATAYALYSGVVVLAVTAIVIAPLAHRLLHRFHAADGDS